MSGRRRHRDMITALDEMDLDAYRRANGMTWAAVASLIGASNPRQARAWGLGIERPSEMQRQRIADATGGVVSVFVMCRVRLEWERANKRPLPHLGRRKPRKRAA